MTSHDNARRILDQGAWRKSTRSSSSGNGNCVEASSLTSMIAVRDSTLATAGEFPALTMDRRDWHGFLAAVRSTT